MLIKQGPLVLCSPAETITSFLVKSIFKNISWQVWHWPIVIYYWWAFCKSHSINIVIGAFGENAWPETAVNYLKHFFSHAGESIFKKSLGAGYRGSTSWDSYAKQFLLTNSLWRLGARHYIPPVMVWLIFWTFWWKMQNH